MSGLNGPSVPGLSVVIPLYNEQENVRELCRRLKTALDGLSCDYEVVLVDDGSRDDTPWILDVMSADDPRLVVIHLSRNFGHQAAITAGLDHARGQAVAVMDGDLQDPPEALPQFYARWREGFDVVYAIRQKRKEGWPKRLAYSVFYRLLKATSDLDIPLDSGDFCLMDRRVVDALRALPERRRFVRVCERSLGSVRSAWPTSARPARRGAPSTHSGPCAAWRSTA